jgi:hypothetical protein
LTLADHRSIVPLPVRSCSNWLFVLEEGAMAHWRILASVIALLITSQVAQAQTYRLEEPASTDTYYRVQLLMALTGQIKVLADDQQKSLKETASAVHDYVERVLEADADGKAVKAARIYKDAKVEISIDGRTLQRALRPENNLLAVQLTADGVLVTSANGPLTRAETDVTDHFESLTISALLPGKEIAVGDSWRLTNSAARALCHLQDLSDQSLTGKLDEVVDDVAVFSLSGTAAGIDLGASVKTTILATGRFDLKHGRVVFLDWKQSEARDQGPVSPASDVDVVVKVTRAPLDAINELSDIAVVPVQTRQLLTDLDFKDPKGRFTLQYAREWYLVGCTEEHTVFRLMDHGEYVAQLTIAPWQKSAAGKHLSPDEIKTIVANSPGWGQDTLLKAEEVKLTTGQWAYLVAGEGDLGNDRAVQYFYFLAGPEGDQAMLTFTMTPTQTQKLGSRDLELVQGFLLPRAVREGSQIKPVSGD